MLTHSLAALASATILSTEFATSVPEIEESDALLCGRRWDFAGETRHFTMQSGGRQREYHVHLPAEYQASRRFPLYVAYHGSEISPLSFEADTGFSNPTVNPGAITVYPRGVDLHWEGPTYATEGVSDLQFTTDLLQQLGNDFCIDETRVYATGHSNGGGFVNTLACDAVHGAAFAAFAGVASALYTDLHGNQNCNPARAPLPVFEAHGTGDEVIPYQGGKGGGGDLPAIPEWIERWAERNSCVQRMDTAVSDKVDIQNWDCSDLRSSLRHIIMDGKDHEYPSRDDETIFISPLVIEFLSAHQKP